MSVARSPPAFSRATIGSGVPPDTITPKNTPPSRFAGRPASLTVGTSGNMGTRRAAATTSPRRRPSFTARPVGSSVSENSMTWPPSTSFSASALPL